MTTRVILVRHGSTVLSEEDRFAGRTNAALSDHGRDQARSLAKRLSKESLEAFYASPLDRTMETASILAATHGKKAQAESAFREIDHGVWEGLTRHEAESKHAKMYARWEGDPFNYAPEGGESGLAVTARAMPALLSLVEKHAGQLFCVVSHKATIRLLLSAVLGFDPRTYRDHLDLSPASLSILDFRDTCHGRLTVFNDVAHYAKDGGAIPPPPEGRLSKVWANSANGNG